MLRDWQFNLYPAPSWVPDGWEDPKFNHSDAKEGWGPVSAGQALPVFMIACLNA